MLFDCKSFDDELMLVANLVTSFLSGNPLLTIRSLLQELRTNILEQIDSQLTDLFDDVITGSEQNEDLIDGFR